MKRILFSVILVLLLCGSSLCMECLKNNIHIQINFEPKPLIVPLKILNYKIVRPPIDPDDKFIVEEGIYCSPDESYLEGFGRFKDKYGENWEIKFSCERLKNQKYSIITVIVIYKNTVLQQNDFSFKGNPVDILNSEVSPFSITGLKTKGNDWFSLTLKID